MKIAALSFCVLGFVCQAAPLEFRGRQSELVISEVSERAVRIQLLSIDANGRAIPIKPTSALITFPQVEKLRIREIVEPREVSSGEMRLTLRSNSIVIKRPDGTSVQELSFDSATNGGVAFRTSAPLLGLGEGAQQFDRRGALYPMEPGWGAWNRPVLGSVVPSPYLIGTDGWAIFAELPEGSFDLRESTGRFLPHTNVLAGAGLDLFIVDAKNPATALEEYYRITGRPVMPPKWALGYFQSHRTLANPAEPLAVARTFREKKLPCDAVIYLGTGYCTNGWNTGHGSVDFNPNAFDQPAEAIRALHDMNFKVVLHVNRAPRNLFGLTMSEESDSPLHIRNYWARHRKTFALGIDGWWPDDGDELPLEARLTRHRTYFEGPLLDRPDERPWSLHRTGYAGVQRYGGWIWSGDIDGAWATLAAHLSIGLNHSLSLTPFWGTDIGGFYPTRELTGELYARWFQFGAFNPLFRSHGRTWHLRLPWGWNTGQMGPIEHPDRTDRAELRNAAIEPICRKYLELRYQLLPYNYSLAREACDTGFPMMRALWLHYENDPEAVKLGDEYLWGRDFLVAPVVEKGAQSRRVYLPAGAWFDFWNGERHEGPKWIERKVDLETMPLYVRAGAIIPFDPVRQFTSEAVTEPTRLKIYPGADGDYTLYNDDGATLGYSKGTDASLSWIRIRWDENSKRATLELDARSPKWPGGKKSFTIELAGKTGPSKRVEFEGKPIVTSF